MIEKNLKIFLFYIYILDPNNFATLLGVQKQLQSPRQRQRLERSRPQGKSVSRQLLISQFLVNKKSLKRRRYTEEVSLGKEYVYFVYSLCL
jgi:hypothetical protein